MCFNEYLKDLILVNYKLDKNSSTSIFQIFVRFLKESSFSRLPKFFRIALDVKLHLTLSMYIHLSLSWQRSLSYRNQSIDLR